MQFRLLFLSFFPLLLAAQLTPDQRESDLRNMAASLGKFYAPLTWKAQAVGFDALNLSSWVRRAREASSDLHFHEVCAEYIASLQDGHTSYRIPSAFRADLGIRVDLFDGRPLLYLVNAARYPAARFPGLVRGAELVSIDGEPALTLIERLAKLQGMGFPRAQLRLAALAVGLRLQTQYARAVELPNESIVVVRSVDGVESTYTLTWQKSGEPFRQTGTPLTPRSRLSFNTALPQGAEVMAQLDPVRTQFLRDALTPQQAPEEWGIAGYGARDPYFGLPADFTVRRGRAPNDTFFTGVYPANGLRIGYLRIPSFSPANPAAALAEMDQEIAFLQANTDGLVLDVSRNPGGSANLALDYMRRFMDRPFYYPPFSLAVRQDRLQGYANIADVLTQLRAERWVIDRWSYAVQALRDASQVGGALTGPVPIVIPTGVSLLEWGPLQDDNFPLTDRNGASLAYRKPMIVLADDFSVSGGDLFPSMFQDNERAPVVGYRTGGLGALVLPITSAMPYSEGQFNYSEGLMIRKRPIATAEYPTAPLIENIGVRPDVEIDFQTRENLINNGRPFFEAFTRAIVEEIRRR